MDRDSLLAAALGAAVLTGCTSRSRPAPAPSASPTPSPAPTDPDVAVLSGWIVEESRLADAYGAIVERLPSIAPLAGNHRDRAEELVTQVARRGAVPPRGGPGGGARTGSPGRVVAELARLEREAAARYLTALGRVADPGVAVLGAELAAGARQHAAVLRRVRTPR